MMRPSGPSNDVDKPSAPPSEGHVQVTDLHVVFPTSAGPVHAVRGVNLSIAPGETVGVVGESGSGKSTLARAIVGLVPPAHGTVTIDGVPVPRLRGRRSSIDAAKAQMIFQDPYSTLNPRQTPISAVAEAVQVCRGLPRNQARHQAMELLKQVGLSETQANLKTRSLSGGQRQRVSIARALAPEPSILVADEPTSALDQSIAASLLNLLRRLQQERNLSVLFISHDLSVIRYVSNRVHVMKDGKFVEHGTTAEVFLNPQQDYTKRLIAAIPGKIDPTALV
jgi:peptide/nickel transport system ATP-binding protein